MILLVSVKLFQVLEELEKHSSQFSMPIIIIINIKLAFGL